MKWAATLLYCYRIGVYFKSGVELYTYVTDDDDVRDKRIL